MGVTLAGTGKILFELPIYRLTRELYDKEFEKYVKKYKPTNSDPKVEIKLNMNLKKDFAGNWEYNEIIGYLEFYILGNDIRAPLKIPANHQSKKNLYKPYIFPSKVNPINN